VERRVALLRAPRPRKAGARDPNTRAAENQLKVALGTRVRIVRKGTAGRIENCQIGVLLTYAAPGGQVLLDRELYLPREWADDAARREEAGVPEAVTFTPKPELARRMLARALGAGGPAAWVTGDSIDGGARRRRGWLEQQEQPFVLAVTSAEPLWAVLDGHWGQPRADSRAPTAARRQPRRADSR